MAPSKSTRIKILLAIDSAFFALELSTGYAVHSLALVADSFHMLNDVLSLCVGLWAVKVANSRANSKTYTYGWQRAETLGALVNGVFLVALCVTIFLDAIQRFVEPQVVSQPKLVLIVGCLGLTSNILGLALFHDHSHSHGPGGHSHGGGEGHDAVKNAEEGHGHSHDHGHSHAFEDAEEAQAADQSGNIVDVLPQNRIGGWPKTATASTGSSEGTAVEPGSPHQHRSAHRAQRSISRRRASSNINDIPINPNAFRKSIIEASRFDPVESDEGTDVENVVDDDEDDTHDHNHSRQPLLNGEQTHGYGATSHKRKSINHSQHKHAQPKGSSSGGGHGHSHGDLNMRGIFLHVMGDALGNIGVIATALLIWLTDYSWRYYADPAISLIITCIILASAIPLCKAASRILLQAVPHGINVDDIKADIEDLPGIVSAHHIHVWQLSDTKLVASLHVQVGFTFDSDGDGSARYMHLAQAIRQCLHEYGIHSSTIQPEFCLDPQHIHTTSDSPANNNNNNNNNNTSPSTATATSAAEGSRSTSKPASVAPPDACLLECGDDCGGGNTCCPPPPQVKEDTGKPDSSVARAEGHVREHGQEEVHSHSHSHSHDA